MIWDYVLDQGNTQFFKLKEKKYKDNNSEEKNGQAKKINSKSLVEQGEIENNKQNFVKT